MTKTGGWVVALLALATAIGCELVDPLDDITDGNVADAGGKVADAGGSPTSSTSSSASSSGTGSSGFDCSGSDEGEPNDSTPATWKPGTTCGVLSSAEDVDQLQFTAEPAPSSLHLVVTAADDLSFQVFHGTNAVAGAANGGGLDVALAAGEIVRIRIFDVTIDRPTKWKVVR